MDKYRYFVSYAYSNGVNESGHGNTEITAALPFRSIKDIQLAEKNLEGTKPKLGTIVILSFQRFEEEPGA